MFKVMELGRRPPHIKELKRVIAVLTNGLTSRSIGESAVGRSVAQSTISATSQSVMERRGWPVDF